MSKGVVALIGRPNVGKSTLFNRIVGERKAIVFDTPGVTRDRLYAKATWLTRDFNVIDTGGLELENRPFQEQIRMQAEIAIDEADVIIYVADGQLGISDDDRYIVKLLRNSNKPVLLAVNKIDESHLMNNVYEFYSLGLGDPIVVSSTHGVGVGDLLDKVVELLPKEEEEENDETIKFSVIGRPNVGKSSLVNAILKEDRVIVSNIEGTTRDAIDTPFTKGDRNYIVIDTAGLKKRGKIYESIDKYAALRSLAAIDKSDVCVLVIDGSVGLQEQDKHVVGYAIEAGKALVVVVNKWDLVDKDENSMAEYEKKIKAELKFIDYASVVFTSALKGQRVDKILSAIEEAYDSYTRRISTSVLNDVLLDATMINPATSFNGGFFRVSYANQTNIKPPLFVLFVNNPAYLHFSYERFMENKLREAFNFKGTPIKFKYKAKG